MSAPRAVCARREARRRCGRRRAGRSPAPSTGNDASEIDIGRAAAGRRHFAGPGTPGWALAR
ncbi:hypothetical protein APASM_1518 [Actinosynnema pretiosum subsp. pretiosum]|nr:hypothetical protein APASM_1518 [Actinosynnema pretiosum subsp. pretiosum]